MTATTELAAKQEAEFGFNPEHRVVCEKHGTFCWIDNEEARLDLRRNTYVWCEGCDEPVDLTDLSDYEIAERFMEQLDIATTHNDDDVWRTLNEEIWPECRDRAHREDPTLAELGDDDGDAVQEWIAAHASSAANELNAAMKANEKRTIIVHLNVEVPATEKRNADQIADSILGALEVGSECLPEQVVEDFGLEGWEWTVPLAEEVG